jgi:hypothetical protein
VPLLGPAQQHRAAPAGLLAFLGAGRRHRPDLVHGGRSNPALIRIRRQEPAGAAGQAGNYVQGAVVGWATVPDRDLEPVPLEPEEPPALAGGSSPGQGTANPSRSAARPALAASRAVW